MTICPNCGNDTLVIRQIEVEEERTFCSNCDTELADCITLTRAECKLLSEGCLNTHFIPRDLYDALSPLIRKIIKFGDTGKES